MYIWTFTGNQENVSVSAEKWIYYEIPKQVKS